MAILLLLTGIAAMCIFLLSEYQSFGAYLAVTDRLLVLAVIILFGDWFYGMFD